MLISNAGIIMMLVINLLTLSCRSYVIIFKTVHSLKYATWAQFWIFISACAYEDKFTLMPRVHAYTHTSAKFCKINHQNEELFDNITIQRNTHCTKFKKHK